MSSIDVQNNFSYASNHQQDVCEFVLSFLNHIDDEFVLNSDSSIEDSFVKQLFEIKMNQSNWCQNCTVNGSFIKTEMSILQENILFLSFPDECALDFPIDQPWHIGEFDVLKLLEDSTNSSRTQKCSLCLENTVHSVKLKILKFPKYLILTINRFSSANFKICCPVNVPLHINLDGMRYVKL